MDHILIVDDEQSIIDILSSHLTGLGYSVKESLCPMQAIQAVRNEEFALVLTDVRMVNLTGIELCQQVAAIRPGLPVVIVTAFGTLEIAIEAIRAGAFDFIVKPIDFESLEVVVEKAIKHFKRSMMLIPGQPLVSVDEVEKRHIMAVLKEVKGNKLLASKVLGMDRTTLYRKLDRYGLNDR